MSTVTLIGKPGCHLCDDARGVIAGVLERFPDAALEELSILDDDELNRRYWDQIPVVLVDGEVHDFWRVDADRLSAALSAPPATGH